jgi:hypothetical protein
MLTPKVIELNRLCAHRAPELRNARPASTTPTRGQVRSAAAPRVSAASR